VLGDSSAMVVYLAKRYPGPATPNSLETEALCLDMWANQQDYYSFVISPLHDYNNPAPQKNGRNLRLVDTRTDGNEVCCPQFRNPISSITWSPQLTLPVCVTSFHAVRAVPQITLAALVTLHKTRATFLETRLRKVADATGSPPAYLCGDEFTFADLFLYTNVRSIQQCKGFEAFRKACQDQGVSAGDDPFSAFPLICGIANNVGDREKIRPTADKFASSKS
jgi:glutathione S-transferase